MWVRDCHFGKTHCSDGASDIRVHGLRPVEAEHTCKIQSLFTSNLVNRQYMRRENPSLILLLPTLKPSPRIQKGWDWFVVLHKGQRTETDPTL